MSEAENIRDDAQYLIDHPLLDRDEIDKTLIRMRNRVQVYISAEQREDDELQTHAAHETKVDSIEPGLSGHEMAAFEDQKFNDTLGEDPGIAI